MVVGERTGEVIDPAALMCLVQFDDGGCEFVQRSNMREVHEQDGQSDFIGPIRPDTDDTRGEEE